MADIWNDLTDSFNKEMAIDEMRKKYLDTYLILQQKDGKEIPVLYRGFSDGYHWFRDELETGLRLRHETSTNVICRFPERCLFNSGKMAYEFIRRPNRQNRRGICKDNASIYSPVARIWGAETQHFSIGLIKDALFPVYPSCCEEAVKALFSESVISIALTPKFMLTQSLTTKKDELYLFYSNVLIGVFNNDTFTIKHPLFKQEVLDNINVFKPFRIEFDA